MGGFLRNYWPILVPLALGLAGVYLLLPQGRRSWGVWGALLCAAALVAGGIWLVHADMALPETILFYAFSGIAVIAGVMMISRTHPVHAALSFALVVLSTCGLFLLQGAPFLMAATIIIYAGAIIVTFLFVVMLAQQAGTTGADQRSREPFLASLAGFVLLGALLVVLQRNYSRSEFDEYLERIGRAAAARSVEEMRLHLGDLDELVRELEAAVPDPTLATDPGSKDPRVQEQRAFWDALRPARTLLNLKLDNVPALKDYLARAHAAGARIRERQLFHGHLRPDPSLPLSPHSGTPPNQVRDGPGKERLPARNVAGLGQSLFTDYLLPVELAGVLLTVATIGAIVIASRGREGLR